VENFDGTAGAKDNRRLERRSDGTIAVEVDLVAVAHVFPAGHRIRLQVSSGAHPRLVRNTGTGEALATAVRLLAADQEVFHDPGHQSTVTLPGVWARG